jgi:mono/diheme cytochrome c family protein
LRVNMRYTTVWFIVILAGFTVAASRLMYAQFDAGRYSQKNSGAIAQPAPAGETDGASYSVSAYPLYPPDLAPGEGREAFQSYCSTCHSTRYITMQPPLPPETWAAEVDKMVKVMGQPIPEDVQPAIIKYLQAHYTPENRKR